MTDNHNPSPFVPGPTPIPTGAPVPGPHVPPAAHPQQPGPVPQPGTVAQPGSVAAATPGGEDYARYQPTVPATGDTVDTGWVVTKGKSSSRFQKEWHMTVFREINIPEGLKWVPTAWKWFIYILMTAVYVFSFYHAVIKQM